MTRPTVRIHNAETNEIIDRPMNDDEFSQWQADKEAGATIGKIARLHIPIQTNPETRFMAWHLNGRQVQEHLDTGSLWYLDTRKPHAVSNQNGAQDRIHLVIDAVVNEALQDWIYGKVSGLL